MKNKALINYYARLILKGTFQESDIPDELREDVAKATEELKPSVLSGISHSFDPKYFPKSGNS
ncbi:MAG: hypothetical protein NC548_12750 [Lachnospiraceae bacterium]|nr:hypothetical protein [Lachnospiraceae bacterium]MCM1230741.1 hypothetical protein [Ruminococcus flavefaciens]